MNVLVTGGTGFIGEEVLRQLVRKGVGVVCLARKPPPPHLADLEGAVHFEVGDVLNPLDLVRALRKAEVHRIVHLAGLGGLASQGAPGLAYEVNILGARNVLEAARIMGVERVVFASSAAVYGDVRGERLTEDSPKNPVSVYGMTKLAIEHLGRTYMENYGLDFVAIRPCTGLGARRVTGSGWKPAGIARSAVQGVPVRMKGGDQTYEMLHVADSAGAFTLAATKESVANKVFHIGTGRRLSLLQVAAIVRRAVPGADIEIEAGFDRTGSDRTRSDQPPMDTARARQEGWVPTYSAEGTIECLVEELRAAAPAP